jgi:hypothetical protein
MYLLANYIRFVAKNDNLKILTSATMPLRNGGFQQ